jgi:hypothetical protein
MADGLGARNYLRVGSNVYSYSDFTNPGVIQDGTAQWAYVEDGGISMIPSYPPWGGGVGFLLPFRGRTISVGQTCSNLGRRYICVVGGTCSKTGGGPVGTGVATALTRFNGVALVTPDGDGNPEGQTYNIGENVDNMVMFSGHPIDLMLWILMSTGTGQNYSGTGTNYDVLPRYQGIGIPYDQINITGFQTVKASLGAMTFHDFFIDEIQSLNFIQEQILQQAHIMLYVNRAGQIDCASITDTYDTAGAITLDQTNIIGIPEFDLNLPTGGYFYNKIVVEFDHHIITDTYNQTLWDVDSGSYTDIREESVLEIKAPLIDLAYSGDVLAERCAGIFLNRFKSPPPLITVSTFDALSLLDPGKIVILDHPNVPNYKIGKDGGPITCQVMTINPEWETGEVKITLLAVGWYS